MKIFNTSQRQQIDYDHRDKDTGVVTKYTLKPNRSANVPDEVGAYLLKGWPRIFSTDEEANNTLLNQKLAIEERDQTIAALTARALKAELALEALADKAEKAAGIAFQSLAEEAIKQADLTPPETAKPAAPAAEAAKKPAKSPKAPKPAEG